MKKKAFIYNDTLIAPIVVESSKKLEDHFIISNDEFNQCILHKEKVQNI